MSSSLLVSSRSAIGLTLAIASILLSSNFTIINAQQEGQRLTNQPGEIKNGTILFQNIGDGFRVQVPEGWVIQDVNNTGSMRSEESRQGYGILAQLCPQEQEQAAAAAAAAALLSNVSGTTGDTASCQGTDEDIIHIIRYPDLDTRLQAANNVSTTNNNNLTIDNILVYHLQKLEQVGYRGIGIVNVTDATLNLINAQTNQTIAAISAKNVEMTYNTNIAPNETRIGYFLLTATNETSPSIGMTKGYSIFYEGPSTSATAATTTTTTPSGSLEPRPLPALVRQVFDSFELVTGVPPPGEEEPFTVETVAGSTEGVAPDTILFEADVQGGTEPYTYSWDFGDGSEVIDEDAVTTHTFEEAGTYNVVLTITDSDSRTASDSVVITITGGEESPVATAEEEVVEEEEQQPPEDGDGEGLLVCIRGGGPPREAELTLEQIEASLELGLAERITIGPCPPAD
jgi:PKD repeat protein